MKSALSLVFGLASFLAISAEAVTERLSAAFANGDYETVQQWFDENVDQKLDGELLYLRGRLHKIQDRNEEAVEDLEKAAKALPDREDIWLQLAEAAGDAAGEKGGMSAAGLAKTARRALEKAVELNPEGIPARVGLIQFHLQAPWIVGGRTKEAYRQAKEIEKIDAVQGQAWKARIDLAEGKSKDAETVFRQILAADPEQADIGVSLAALLHGKKAWAEAIEVLKPFADADPPHLASLYQLGRTGALSGQHLDQAAAAMGRYVELAALDEEPPIPLSPAYWRLGMIYEHQKLEDKARQAFEKALELDPDNEEAEKALAALGS